MADVMIYSTLARETNTQKLARAIQIDGGYFVWEGTLENLNSTDTWQEGQLCFLTQQNQFYQYKGTTQKWQPLEGFGTPGEDGKTPTFMLLDGTLQVSYDDGKSWESLGNVKGADGAPGDNGDPGQDGLTPFIGENGNWWIGDTDTGVHAQGPEGPQGPAGANGTSDGSGTILKAIGMVNYKSKRLVSGETFEVKPNTLVMVNGKNFTQTLVGSATSTTKVTDSEGNAIPSFGAGLLFNTDEADGFRSNMMLGISGGLLGTTLTNKNYDAAPGQLYIRAGDTPTWIFFSELSKDTDSTADEVAALRAEVNAINSKSHSHSFSESSNGSLTFNSNDYVDPTSGEKKSKTRVTISTQTTGSGASQGGNVKVYTYAGNPGVEMWAKSDMSGEGQSVLRVRAEKDEGGEGTTYRTEITPSDVKITDGASSRSLRHMLPWGYSVKIVTNESQCTDSKVIYIVTG